MPTDPTPTPADIEAGGELWDACLYGGADAGHVAHALATARANADAAGYARARVKGLQEAARIVRERMATAPRVGGGGS